MRTNDRDELLQFYRDELAYLRGMGSEFAAAHKKLAGRLELSDNECADPHVERLIQSFAFLTARLQLRLNEEFPEITTALLGTLYPQLINPIPAMSIARFEPDPAQGQNTTGDLIPALTQLFHNTPESLTCRFRTCYPVTLWPLQIAYAAIEDTSEVSFISTEDNVAAVLHLKLRCPKGVLKELQLDRLRFFLNGDPILVNALYEILFTNVEKVAVLPGAGQRPYYLPPGAIARVGFGLDEEVLPYPSNAHPAYRLLQEYFYFPEKYHFIDLELNLHRNLLRLLENNLESLEAVEMLELFILLRERPAGNLFITTDTFNLGCTPVINLFPKTTEPIRVDHRSLEYHLIADKRRESTTEIHSIQSVSASSDPNKPAQYFEPFYSYNHFLDSTKHRAFWHAVRRNSTRQNVPGTEVYISFLDLNFEPVNPPVQTVYAHTLCTNRELPTRLPKNVVLYPENKMPTHTITLIGKRSLPLSPLLGGSTVWRLISHLSLNHLSLSEGGDSLNALREILGLYCASNRPSTQDQINGITEMEIAKKSIYLKGQDAWRGFRRGTQITLTFDEAKYRGSSAFLLGAVLNSFFALYTSVNSFTQLKIKKRAQPDTIWKAWEPMAGERFIL
ncbi:MAG TPA: type VI secretion system baseplate subunit TssF [Pyrinomonadaceae bacterium]|jgi:type VI secretion system protein ImpG